MSQRRFPKSDYSGVRELADAELGLNRYYGHIVEKITSNKQTMEIFKNQTKILEFGAGTGFLAELMKAKTSYQVDCVEIDPYLISSISSKNLICYQSLSELRNKYDFIYSSNVLEHIENDVQSLRELREVLQPNGILALYLPAFNILFSDLDRAVGHYRRYSRKEIISKLTKTGYEVIDISYVDSLGFPASLLIRIIGYQNKADIGGLRSMRLYDSVIFPISVFLDKLGLSRFIGKNLVVHCRIAEE